MTTPPQRSPAKEKLAAPLREIAQPPKEQDFHAVLTLIQAARQRVWHLLDFLQLPDGHAERDLQHALIKNLKQFLLELGPDFCFVGEEFLVQVGNQDFFIDLLFFHRGLQALVAIELKIDAFKPMHLGQLEFYLEALDRDHRKSYEAPSIGVLLCKTRDAEVVKYALSRSLSPALVAEYETKLPDKALLQAKLDELYALIASQPEGLEV